MKIEKKRFIKGIGSMSFFHCLSKVNADGVSLDKKITKKREREKIVGMNQITIKRNPRKSTITITSLTFYSNSYFLPRRTTPTLFYLLHSLGLEIQAQ